MRSIWVGVVLAGLLCAGCSDDEEPVEVTTTDSAGRTTVITQEVTATPTPSPGPESAPTTVALTSVVLETSGGNLEIDLPETWTVQPLPEAERTQAPDAEAQAPQQWCLVPPSPQPTFDGCAGVLVAAGPDWLPGHGGAAYSLRQDEGWRSTPGPIACPVTEDGEPTDAARVTATPDQVDQTQAPGEDAGDEDDAAEIGVEELEPDGAEVDLLVTASEGLPLTSVETEVNGRRITYETWRASCTLSETVVIAPQVWHDRELGVLVRDYVGLPDTLGIVESLRAA